MTDALPNPGEGPEQEGKLPSGDKDAWKLVYFGQLSRELVPYHPEPPETPEDELTRAALTDPDGATRGEAVASGPTFWRVLVLMAVAIIALALVFWRTH